MAENDNKQTDTSKLTFGILKNTQTIKKMLEELSDDIKNKFDNISNETSEIKKQNQELERKLKVISLNQLFWN